MKRENDNDGLSRKKRLEEIRIDRPFRAMEDDFFHLCGRIQENAAFIRYFNSKNVPAGYWKELYQYQPVVVLLEIMLYNVREKERTFMNTKTEKDRNSIMHEVQVLLITWQKRLKESLTSSQSLLYSYLTRHLQFLQNDLEDQTRFNEAADLLKNPLEDGEEKEEDLLLFYNNLNLIRTIQQNYEIYWNDFVSEAAVDPSVAVIIAFIKNYKEVVSRYNRRWELLPEFYLKEILHVQPRSFRPWTTWLVLDPDKKAGTVCVPAGTGFIAGKQSDETPILYRNEKEGYLSQMELKKVFSYYFDEILLQKDLSMCIHPEGDPKANPQSLFYGKKGGVAVSAGILVESSLFWLKEGERHINIRFDLAEERSLNEVKDEISDISKFSRELKNAFCPQISTEEGWNAISECTFTYQENDRVLNFHFFLPADFPSTAACSDLHGWVSRSPAVRLLMNPEAEIYPYKWMSGVCLEKIRIEVKVSGLTEIEIQTSMGPADSSQPFFPFGSMPEQGAWMSWKNQEITRKKVREVALACVWLQLPVSGEGFYSLYKTYTPPLDNSSFQIRKEYLSGNRWMREEKDKSDLFLYRDPKGEVQKENSYDWSVDTASPVDGVFRMVLTDPAIGFGHQVYRKMFNDCAVRNSFKKKKQIPPEAPVTPFMEVTNISYIAEEEIGVGCPDSDSTALYYVHPSMEDLYKKVEWVDPPLFFEGVSNQRNLLFGLENAIGEIIFRLFVDIALLHRTLKRSDTFRVSWFIKKGEWDWYRLPSEMVYTDTTQHFWQTGLIELRLTEPISEEWLDESGLCWIGAVFSDREEKNHLSPVVYGFYMNSLQVTLDMETPGFDGNQHPRSLPAGTIRNPEKVLPGIASICQIIDAYGGSQEESVEEMKVRITNQISHRNRAVTKRDYEDLAIGNFKEIGKAYCLCSSLLPFKEKNQERAQVTLIVTPATYREGWYPLCDNILLWQIEDFIQMHTSPFVKVYVRNPFYEEITVYCQVTLLGTDIPWGEVKRDIKKRIDHCIAPWLEEEEPPVFNYSFGIYDMKNEIGNSDYIQRVTSLVIMHRHSDGMYRYILDKSDMNDPKKRIKASFPGNILFPGKNHLIYTSGEKIPKENVGIDELEIENTFIIA